MGENKWVGLSRSLWSALLPILTIVLTAAGVTSADEIGAMGTSIVNGGAIIASAILQYLHQRNPKLTSAAQS